MTQGQAFLLATDLWARAEAIRVDCWNYFGESAPNDTATQLVHELYKLLEIYQHMPPATPKVGEPTPDIP